MTFSRVEIDVGGGEINAWAKSHCMRGRSDQTHIPALGKQRGMPSTHPATAVIRGHMSARRLPHVHGAGSIVTCGYIALAAKPSVSQDTRFPSHPTARQWRIKTYSELTFSQNWFTR